MRRLAFFTLVAASAVLGCGDDKKTVSEPPLSYSLTVPANVSVGQDSAVNLKSFGLAVVREDGIEIPGTNTTTAPNLPRLSYFPADLSIAVVDETGNLRGVRGGTTILRVQGYDDEIEFPVEVRPHPATSIRLTVLSSPDGGFINTRADTGTFYAFPADLETSRLEGLVLVESPGRVDTVYCNYCVVPASPAPVRTPRFVRFRSLDPALATVSDPGDYTSQTSVAGAARVRTLDTVTSGYPARIVMEVPGDSAEAEASGGNWKDTVYLKIRLRPIDTLRLDPGTHRVSDLERPEERTASAGTTTLFENQTWPGDSSGANVVQSASENFSLVATFRSRIRSVPNPPGTANPSVTYITMQSTNATTVTYRAVTPTVTFESALNSYLQINTSGGVVGLCEYIGRTDRCPAPARSGSTATTRARDSLIVTCTDMNSGSPPDRRLPGTKVAVAPATVGTLVNPAIAFGGAGAYSIPGCPVVAPKPGLPSGSPSLPGPNIPMPGAFCTSSNAADITSVCTVWIRATAIDPVTGKVLRRLYRVNIKKS